jgi:hypothetical protein
MREERRILGHLPKIARIVRGPIFFSQLGMSMAASPASVCIFVLRIGGVETAGELGVNGFEKLVRLGAAANMPPPTCWQFWPAPDRGRSFRLIARSYFACMLIVPSHAATKALGEPDSP